MKSIPVSILLASVILGISFIIGCFFLSNQESVNEPTQVAQEEVAKDKVLVTIQETAEYLSMTEEQVMSIIHAEQRSFAAAGSFNGTMFPFIKVQDEFFISRIELLLWAQDASLYHRRYVNGQLQ
ncbi:MULTISPECIES: hypothetical protein [Paenibacillus]|uniref:Uncharacterized protein n=1 Tax=Paenibacillus illinoisensis TaxID=59845 RepID=A0A2W0CD39_9BACL|nr:MULTISPECIES: hypothetical protein [Paenibacillus]PAD29954.1 hypothetical protein CHH60_17590 [Paenibacillus sp. 7523-1]PYY29934.1 Uncharacterized protein PIL02S_01531 [Paenibacillus illinoisensis]